MQYYLLKFKKKKKKKKNESSKMNWIHVSLAIDHPLTFNLYISLSFHFTIQFN
jgi:hypothetical protein